MADKDDKDRWLINRCVTNLKQHYPSERTCWQTPPVMVRGKRRTMPRPRFCLFLCWLNRRSSFFSSSSRELQYWGCRTQGSPVSPQRHTPLLVPDTRSASATQTRVIYSEFNTNKFIFCEVRCRRQGRRKIQMGDYMEKNHRPANTRLSYIVGHYKGEPPG